MRKKDVGRAFIMFIILLIMAALTLYSHRVLKTGRVFTHFFYIPIALASLWWKKRGIYVALFLSAMLVLSYRYAGGYDITVEDYIRVSMFFLVGTIIAVLSEQLLKEKKAKEYFAEESVTDALTGLRNYTFFEKNSELLFDLCRQKRSVFCLVIVDIDNFKRINDTYGHKTGDNVLKNFSNAAKRTFRGSDILMRYGGDEFLFLLPGVKKNGVEQVIRRLKKDIEQDPVYHEGKAVSYSFCWGAAEYDGTCGSIDEMFNKADQELYSGKARN